MVVHAQQSPMKHVSTLLATSTQKAPNTLGAQGSLLSFRRKTSRSNQGAVGHDVWLHLPLLTEIWGRNHNPHANPCHPKQRTWWQMVITCDNFGWVEDTLFQNTYPYIKIIKIYQVTDPKIRLAPNELVRFHPSNYGTNPPVRPINSPKTPTPQRGKLVEIMSQTGTHQLRLISKCGKSSGYRPTVQFTMDFVIKCRDCWWFICVYPCLSTCLSCFFFKWNFHVFFHRGWGSQKKAASIDSRPASISSQICRAHCGALTSSSSERALMALL